MRVKICPSCGSEVPESANRCKQCFHDFTVETETRSKRVGPLAVLASFAAMAIAGTLILLYIVSRPVEERILVDEDTQSVVWTRKFRNSIETERLRFDEIAKLEYVRTATGRFEIVAVDHEGGRHVIQEDEQDLRGEAGQYAKLMGKPLAEVDNTTSFGREG
jgi:transposase-like protein